MLETVDLGAKLAKDDYKNTMAGLDLRLAELQRALRGN